MTSNNKLNNLSIILFLSLLVFSCGKKRNDTKISIYQEGGFILSFDDNYIHNWYEISDLLDRYKCKATFFVSEFGYLDIESINLLKQLKNKGHEIAVHSLNHNSAIEYLDSSNIEKYIKSEIIPEIDSMRSHGFDPMSFAYPFGDNNKALDLALLEHFALLRDVSESQRHFFLRYFKKPHKTDEVFINDSSLKVLPGLGIDENYNISIKDIHKIFKRANNYNEVVLFYCHNPVDKVYDNYQIQIDYLESFLKLTKKYNLKSYRFIDLVKNND